MSISRQVLDLAARQGGYVTRVQLLELDLSPSAIDRRVNEEDLSLVTPGVYLVIPSDSHVDLLRGAVLALPEAVVSHQSAAHLLRFPTLPELIPTVVVPIHTTHRFPGVTVRRRDDLDSSDIIEVDGLEVTNIPRTLFDLAGILRFKKFDRIGESLVIAGRLELEQFDEITHRLARREKPGSRSARLFLEMRFGDPPGATVLERKGRSVLASADLPTPEPQFPIPWSLGRRFDDAYPLARVAIEWDSRAWHEQRAAMASDRKRDRDAAAHGWVVLRYTWDDMTEKPQEITDTVSSLLAARQAAG